MRKKYLSALLFGALLLASAGTFTSCKDYDDDIKNLQEQINTVKTSLDELTTKVNNLGAGIKDFKYENGQLVIVTDKDTNFTVDMPECEGIVKLEIKDGVLYADDVAVGNVSGDGGSVVEVKDGVLYIDGKAQDLTIGNKVVVKDNGDGTYTLTVDGVEYVLPKSVATDFTVYGGYLFTEYGATAEYGYGISWGTATADVDWKGPKGAVKAGQFLVGQTSELSVRVSPMNFELDKVSLKLVDSEGNVAPVVISATPVGTSDIYNSNTRSTDKQGNWLLNIAFDETVSETNMGSEFATTLAATGASANKKYALMSDGRLVSGYSFVVDTNEKATTSNNAVAQYKLDLDFNKECVRVDGTAIAGGVNPQNDLLLNAGHKLEYRLPDVYDYKFSISAEDQNDAEKWGITLVDNVLKGTDKAAGKDVDLVLTVIGVNGTVKTYTDKINVSFGDTKADAEELTATTYQLTNAREAFVVNLENTFSDLTAEEATYLTKAEWSVDDAGFMVKESAFTAVKYYADEACETEVLFNDDDDNIKNIKYAKFIVKKNVSETAAPGKYTLTLTLSGANGEVKKVNVPVTVTLPSFSEIFNKSAAWSEDKTVATLRFDAEGKADITSLYAPVDKDSYQANWWGASTFAPVNNKAIVSISGTEVTALPTIVDKGVLKSTTAEAVYNVCDRTTAAVESGEFTVKFLTVLDGAQIVNYDKDGKQTAFTVNGDAATFMSAETNGFALVLNGKKYVGLNNSNVEGLALDTDEWDWAFDDNAGKYAEVEVTSYGNIKVSKLATGNYKTKLTLTYKKSIKNIEAHTPIVIELDVKNGTAQN